jgi:tRNA modification GTPase
VVINKIDTNANADPSTSTQSPLAEKRRFCEAYDLDCIETSLTQKINREQLFNAIGSAARRVMEDAPVPEIIVNERHRGIVERVARDLRQGIESLDAGRDEIAAHFLKSALEKLSEFSGFVSSDEVLDGIFDRFCIGK